MQNNNNLILLERLSQSPDLVQAIINGEIDNRLAIAIMDGEVEITPLKFERNTFEIKLLNECIAHALTILYEKHRTLLTTDVNERSVTHKLAEELQKIFREWDVDCEYNRIDGDSPKKLLLNAVSIESNDTEATTVYPDIIIHKRGMQSDNIIVIEVKKDGRDPTSDVQKLKGFTTELSYRYGLLIMLKNNLQETIFGIKYFSGAAGGEERSIEDIEWDENSQNLQDIENKLESEESDRFQNPENYDDNGDKIDVPEWFSGSGEQYQDWVDSNDRG